MPTRKMKQTTEERLAYQADILQLKQLGILPGSAGQRQVPKNLCLNSWHGEVAQVRELLWSDVAVILPLELMALTSDILISGYQITVRGEPLEFDLEEPESHHSYAHLENSFYHKSPTILNQWMIGRRRLPKRNLRGVILGVTSMQIPPLYPDGRTMEVKLMFQDEREANYFLDFDAILDRSLKLKYERERQAQRFDSAQRTGIFGPAQSRQYGESTVRMKQEHRGSKVVSNVARRFGNTMSQDFPDTGKTSRWSM